MTKHYFLHTKQMHYVTDIHHWMQLSNGNYVSVIFNGRPHNLYAMEVDGHTPLPHLMDAATPVGNEIVAMLPEEMGVLPTDSAFTAAMKIYKHTGWPPLHPGK
jgi:hypothetical protein